VSSTTLPVFSKYSEGYGIKCIYGLEWYIRESRLDPGS
jgi:hypothetical protein